ncbi:uroporphyrinogen decarboxylase/cobalamine-independent methonine synthase family protein [Parasphingopyxis marina]|uniref:Epoxyalkane--coenzyme M transferase n=1 Tax=Parasphingopyxis marina TaxID=2761622 RepID=A0A842I0A5_9SPHN|nr:epoxyalkane--coenzyme M transferase [Parasphingopyxis marina]MBC2778652.1 epoxyalkane--coenzyme M transferase [Parasphingopyxis marina]
MRRSSDKILVTHVGALPAPPDVWGQTDIPDQRLAEAVGQVVDLQKRAGVDFVNEGELTKGGNWLQFVTHRLSGFEPSESAGAASLMFDSADWKDYAEFYRDALASGTLFEESGTAPAQGTESRSRMDWSCTGPIAYVGQELLQREIDTLKSALGDTPPTDAFLTSTAPSSLEVGRTNEYYDSDEAFLFAIADAMAVEYEAIAAAGLQLQVDDAWLAGLWDRIGIPMGIDAYRKYCEVRVEALNHALRNVPEEQVRYHICWGSWHGPHSQDLPMADIVDILLKIDAQTYLFEAANVRHEHEAAIWERVKLPEGKILAPGVVSHATRLIEHPELVANRIGQFASMVGHENVIASTDCGLGLRCHPQIAWGKLAALAEGAALASEKLAGKPVAA